ncbi:16S rRNA (guanine527-N7)-methyltransferase [Aquimarina sp. EL_43]|uniref:16S rRNA (guanine(527)-N(7))-methyltransferase RsmG n=1 Tax=unclassified Aquimarina TaxID=2627091 RepID=UPI0018CB680D|nr:MULTISPECIES: 16S rRNA (guanine(527)-N(7))-methyltransferase RsmG [unclassified Aquimarina]MBG6131253.1 16S rRNA (guanine527-N7)-methyltransferase [Aquimarina sp. EL_35]MBG6151865.1 16S rRNA (guanine527-N7)-methyltransferase [Aquimarina sp. EL_32]MBG6169795.1 16S rRNA (guanine527-N7)-methyltransferase [Aquimarina sp. EL_43]
MDILQKYFQNITEEQRLQFSRLGDLYTEWNAKINVISRKDIESLYERHILHSLGIAKILEFKPGTHVLDVGTGGGFPGIPLAILFPETQFYLVDVIAKKIRVVNEVAKALDLHNIKAEQRRAGTFDSRFDFIVSRAVTNMPDFVKWVRKNIAKKNNHELQNGILYLKGGDLTEELALFPKAIQHNLSDYFEEEFFETKKVVYLPLKYKI